MRRSSSLRPVFLGAITLMSTVLAMKTSSEIDPDICYHVCCRFQRLSGQWSHLSAHRSDYFDRSDRKRQIDRKAPFILSLLLQKIREKQMLCARIQAFGRKNRYRHSPLSQQLKERVVSGMILVTFLLFLMFFLPICSNDTPFAFGFISETKSSLTLVFVAVLKSWSYSFFNIQICRY